MSPPASAITLAWIQYEGMNRNCNREYLLHPNAVGEAVLMMMLLRDDQPLHLVTTRFRMRRDDVRLLWGELKSALDEEAQRWEVGQTG